MSQIKIEDLSFYYEGSYDMIFDHVSFAMDSNWKLGLIGRNGKGKTTLLRLLLGIYEYQGRISSNLKFEYFPFSISKEDEEQNTIDVIECMDAQYELWRVLKELSLLEVDAGVLYRTYRTLSFGERTKVMLAVLFAKENQFLLIDEPTNHLDQEARECVKQYLQKKKGFILVSHDRELLNVCIDHVLVLNRATIEVEQGNFDSWWANKERKDAFELAEEEKLRKDIKRLKEAAKKANEWADKVESTKIGFDPTKVEKNITRRPQIAEKSKRMQQRKKNLTNRQDRAIEEKSALLSNIEETPKLKIQVLPFHKERYVKAKDFSIYYEDTCVLQKLNFEIRAGERVALQGKNGCGKSSFLKAILGQDLKTTGTLEVANGLKLSYISQDTCMLTGTIKEYASKEQIELSRLMTILRKLDFSREQFENKMEQYSEGQKKKVLLAKSLCEEANLYIWDEPLNYIDVFSRMQLEELLLEYQPTILLVEHDRTFVENVCTHTYTIK